MPMTQSSSHMISRPFWPGFGDPNAFAKSLCNQLNLPSSAATQIADYDKYFGPNYYQLQSCPNLDVNSGGWIGPMKQEQFSNNNILLQENNNNSNTNSKFNAENCSFIGPSEKHNCTPVQVFCKERLEYQFSLDENSGIVLVRPINKTTGESYGNFGTICSSTNYYPYPMDGTTNSQNNNAGIPFRPYYPNTVSAKIMCDLLRLPSSGAQTLTGKVFGDKNKPIYLQDLSCPDGSVNSSDCTYLESNNSCTHEMDFAVICAEKTDFILELVPDPNDAGAPPSNQNLPEGSISGFVVVKPASQANNKSYPFGTVCAFGGFNGVDEVCSLVLGLPMRKVISSWTTRQAPSEYANKMYLTQVDCTDVSQPQLTSFSQCKYSQDVQIGCSLWSAVYLTCSPKTVYNLRVTADSLAFGAALLETSKPYSSSEKPVWAPVCAEKFVDAKDVCTILGLPSSAASATWMSTIRPITGDLQLRISEQNLPAFEISALDCSEVSSSSSSPSHVSNGNTKNCSYSDDTSQCQNYERLYLTCDDLWTNPQFSVDQDTSGKGLLMMKPNNSANVAWGTICATTVPSMEIAQTFCTLLGEPDVTGAKFSSIQTNVGDLPIYARQLDCPPSATDFSQCTFTQNSYGCLGKQYPYVLGLICRNKEDFEIKLDEKTQIVLMKPLMIASGNNNNSNSNQHCNNNNNAWGYLCDGGLAGSAGKRTARTLCRMQGLPFGAATLSVGSIVPSQFTAPMMTSLSCDDTATSLFQCSYDDQQGTSSIKTPLSSASCNANHGVQLRCQDSPLHDFSIGKTQQQDDEANVLRVRANHSSATWSFVCAASNHSASFLCESMGYSGVGARLIQKSGITTSFNEWKILKLDCPPGSTRSTADCNVQTTTYPCPSTNAVIGLVCPKYQYPSATPSPSSSNNNNNNIPYLFQRQSPRGELEARLVTSSKWKKVCSEPKFDQNDATQMCRVLGYNDCEKSTSAVVSDPNLLLVDTDAHRNASFVLNDVSCPSSSSLSSSNSFSVCNSSTNISQTCSNETVAAIFPNSNEYFSNGYFFKLDPKTKVLFVRAQTPYSVENSNNNNNENSIYHQWNVFDTTTDVQWNSYAARTLCATVGQNPSSSATFGATAFQLESPRNASLLRQLSCPANANGDLTQCWFQDYLAEQQTTLRSTQTTSAAVLHCPPSIPQLSKDVAMHISFSSSLRVELASSSQSNQQQSGEKKFTICVGNDFEEVGGERMKKTCQSLCHMAGYASVAAARCYKISGRPSQQSPLIKNLKCPSSGADSSIASSLDDCSFDYVDTSSSSQDSCNDPTKSFDLAIDCANNFQSPISNSYNGFAFEASSNDNNNGNNNNNNGAPPASNNTSPGDENSKPWLIPTVVVIIVATVGGGVSVYLVVKNARKNRGDGHPDGENYANEEFLDRASTNGTGSNIASYANIHRHYDFKNAQSEPGLSDFAIGHQHQRRLSSNDISAHLSSPRSNIVNVNNSEV